jgi:hypothetical protein
LPEQNADSEYSDIDVTGATEALEKRLEPSRETLQVARDTESGKFTSKPQDEDTAPAAGDEAAATADDNSQETVEQAEEDAETPFTHIPDEALSPEMLAVKRAMQADYTRKTQEVAPFRKLAQEFGVESPDELRERLEIQRQLSDPQNWPKLHEELTTYLQSQGLSPRAAQDAAAVTLGQATGGIGPADDDYVDGEDDYGDGGLPPALQQRLDQMEKQQNELIQMMYQREQQAQQEAEMAQLAQHLTRQENEIRAKYRDSWGDKADDYIETVYDLSGDNGDLSVGLARLETILGYDASRYLVGKEEAKRAPGPVVGEGVIASEQDDAPHTLEEGHARALEFVRQQAEAEAGL